MNDIKLSIIIPMYNAEKYIEKCIKSILNQTLEEIEIIIVNDGSTDNSLEIVKKYEENKKIIIQNNKNEGLTKTRNNALKLAKGKYIYFMDADDYLEENEKILENLYNIIEKNEFDILIFDYFKDKVGKKEYIDSTDRTEDLIVNKNLYLKDLINEKYRGVVWNKIIKKSLYLENNINFLENIFMKEDLDVTLKLVYYSSKIGKIKKAYYNYVMHDNQGTKTISKEKRINDEYYLYLDLERFFEKNNNECILKILKSKKWKLYKNILKKNKKVELYETMKSYVIKNRKEILKLNWSFEEKIRFYIYSFFI